MPTVSDLPAIATLFLGLFGDFLIYIAAPILIVSIFTDLFRDWFRDDSEPVQLPPRYYEEPSVPSYLSTSARIERRQGSRKR